METTSGVSEKRFPNSTQRQWGTSLETNEVTQQRIPNARFVPKYRPELMSGVIDECMSLGVTHEEANLRHAMYS